MASTLSAVVSVVLYPTDHARHLAYSSCSGKYLSEKKEGTKEGRKTERFRKVSKMIHLGHGEVKVQIPVSYLNFILFPISYLWPKGQGWADHGGPVARKPGPPSPLHSAYCVSLGTLLPSLSLPRSTSMGSVNSRRVPKLEGEELDQTLHPLQHTPPLIFEL